MPLGLGLLGLGGGRSGRELSVATISSIMLTNSANEGRSSDLKTCYFNEAAS